MCALYGELIGCGYKRQASKSGNLGSRLLGKTRSRVDTCSYRCTSQRQAVHTRKRGLDPLQIICQHPRVTGPFLAQCKWGSVLHVCASDLDDVFPRMCLGIDCIM